MHDLFRQFAVRVSGLVGSGWALMLAVALAVGTGFYNHFSEAWKFNASLAASLTALLLIFFLQKSQNHSDKATHLKLDELIRALDGARNEIASAEHQAERDMEELRRENDPDDPV